MHSLVDMLTKWVAPPSDPVGAGSAKQWRQLRAVFGFPFPDDFCSLVDVYGGGGFFGEIGICSPFSPYRSFTDWHAKNLTYSRPDLFPTFSESSGEGLLQVGGDCNGGNLFLLFRDNDATTFVYGNREHDELHVHAPGVTSYLIQIAMGRQCPPSYELTTPASWGRTFECEKPPPTPEQLKAVFGEPPDA